MNDERKPIKTVLVAMNGMVACCDGAGEQMADCQGFILDISDILKERCDENTEWEFGGQIARMSWYWKQKKESEEIGGANNG